MNKIDEKAEQLSKELQAELDEVSLRVSEYSLSDAIREGSLVTEHSKSGWGDGDSACALSAGVIAARRRGHL